MNIMEGILKNNMEKITFLTKNYNKFIYSKRKTTFLPVRFETLTEKVHPLRNQFLFSLVIEQHPDFEAASDSTFSLKGGY